jgi:acetyl esterase/lipase
MKSKKTGFFKLLLAGLSYLAIHTSAFATSAICAQVENDPATRHVLEPSPDNIEGFEPYIYKSVGRTDLRLHVFKTDTKNAVAGSKKPAILFFYGGAWEYGSVKEFIDPARYFSTRGAVGILVDYRVFCRHGSSIADEISDAKSAVRYVRSHATQLGIDPNRIVVIGGSAGGHLALSTATLDGFESDDEDHSISSKPNLLALLYPCSDVTTADEKMYGGDAIGEYGKEASPLYHIHPNLPPMLIIQGTDDIVYQENKKFCAESTAMGNMCEFVVYKDAYHGFFGPEAENSKWYQQAQKKMDSFLMQAGYLRHK